MNRKALGMFFGVCLLSAPVFAQAPGANPAEKPHQMEVQNEKAVSLDQVPQPARAKIEKEAKGKTITKVEQAERNGKTIYEAEFESHNKVSKLEVSPEGKVLKREHHKK